MRYYGKYEKYGKFERRPDRTSAKQPQTKSMLLQAYFAGLLCLVLCVTMFFGTTYAWFTSEITNTGNGIYVGSLKAGLYKVADGEYIDLAEKDNLFNTSLGEGATVFATVAVRNQGNLELKYELTFKATSSESNTVSEEATGIAAALDVWVYKHSEENTVYPQEVTKEQDWTYVGTLAKLLAGKLVLDGEMTEDEVWDSDTGKAVQTEHIYTIALRLQEGKYDSLKGQNITFDVKLKLDQLDKSVKEATTEESAE